MASLHAHMKMKKKVDAKKQPVLLDLDNEDSEVADADASGVVKKEKQSFEQLNCVLSTCQKCGPTTACKINKYGVHITLTFGQH
jgi:hypothetical protein